MRPRFHSWVRKIPWRSKWQSTPLFLPGLQRVGHDWATNTFSILTDDRLSCLVLGFPGGASGKEPACQCRRHKRCGFNPCVGKIPWRRKWKPTPVFLPGESHGHRSLGGYSPWGRTESDKTESDLALALASQLLNCEVRHHGNKALFSPDLFSS